MTVDNSSCVRIGNGGNKSASSGPSIAPTVLRGCWDVEMVVVKRRAPKWSEGYRLGQSVGHTPVGYSRWFGKMPMPVAHGKKVEPDEDPGAHSFLGNSRNKGANPCEFNGS